MSPPCFALCSVEHEATFCLLPISACSEALGHERRNAVGRHFEVAASVQGAKIGDHDRTCCRFTGPGFWISRNCVTHSDCLRRKRVNPAKPDDSERNEARRIERVHPSRPMPQDRAWPSPGQHQ